MGATNTIFIRCHPCVKIKLIGIQSSIKSIQGSHRRPTFLDVRSTVNIHSSHSYIHRHRINPKIRFLVTR